MCLDHLVNVESGLTGSFESCVDSSLDPSRVVGQFEPSNRLAGCPSHFVFSEHRQVPVRLCDVTNGKHVFSSNGNVTCEDCVMVFDPFSCKVVNESLLHGMPHSLKS